jgi:hypothetical protein
LSRNLFLNKFTLKKFKFLIYVKFINCNFRHFYPLGSSLLQFSFWLIELRRHISLERNNKANNVALRHCPLWRSKMYINGLDGWKWDSFLASFYYIFISSSSSFQLSKSHKAICANSLKQSMVEGRNNMHELMEVIEEILIFLYAD